MGTTISKTSPLFTELLQPKLVPIEMPTICLYNLEQNLIIYYPKDNGELNKLPDLTTNYIFHGLSGCSEVTQSVFVKPNKVLYQKFVELIQIFFVYNIMRQEVVRKRVEKSYMYGDKPSARKPLDILKCIKNLT